MPAPPEALINADRKRCADRWPDFVFSREQDPKYGWVVRATATVNQKPMGLVVVVTMPWSEEAWLHAERFVLNGMLSVMEALDAVN